MACRVLFFIFLSEVSWQPRICTNLCSFTLWQPQVASLLKGTNISCILTFMLNWLFKKHLAPNNFLMVKTVCYYHRNFCFWSYQLAYHLAVFTEFSLEKAADSIIPVHYVSSIFNEVTRISEVISWCIQVTCTSYWAIAEHNKMWWTEWYNFCNVFLSNIYLLRTVMCYNRREIFSSCWWSSLMLVSTGWGQSATALFLFWDVAVPTNGA